MVYFPMKRLREAEPETTITNIDTLMLFSRGPTCNISYESLVPLSRVFECKTCNRRFTSFQALGGHRASHKKPRLSEGDMTSHHITTLERTKPKRHECSICGLEFAIGQALGGHMRRHKEALATAKKNHSSMPFDRATPMVKEVSSGMIFSLDLNLTPLENDLEFRVGKVVPTTIDLFI